MSVDVLLDRLRDGAAADRARAALEAAGADPSDELIEALEAATRDDSEQVRAAAVRTLEQLRAAPEHFIDRAAQPLETPPPKYPPAAFVGKIEGTVTVQISINAAGRVTDAKVVKSIPALDAAALATVRRWRFQPALVRGRPVGETREVPVKFAIY